MSDLRTNFMGLELINPLVISASPFTEDITRVVELEKAGAGAVVMHSLFEEQITQESLALDHHLEYGTNSFAEALSYFPKVGRYSLGTETYLKQIESLKKNVQIPIIASLNGTRSGKWVEYAKKFESAGADALELNLYYLPTDSSLSSAELENNYLELVQNVVLAVSLPVAVKISPFYTSLPNFARLIAEVGARGLTLFNRFYQPDFDIDELEIVHKIELSQSYEMLLPLRWVAILSGQIDIDFALTSGVKSGKDLIKAMMSGAKITMIASEILKKGPTRVTEILEEIKKWMDEKDYHSIQQMQGSMNFNSVSNPTAFERANYMKVLSSYKELP